MSSNRWRDEWGRDTLALIVTVLAAAAVFKLLQWHFARVLQ